MVALVDALDMAAQGGDMMDMVEDIVDIVVVVEVEVGSLDRTADYTVGMVVVVAEGGIADMGSVDTEDTGHGHQLDSADMGLGKIEDWVKDKRQQA